MAIKRARNNSHSLVNDSLDLTADQTSNIIDYNEMNTLAIQLIFTGAGASDGTWSLEVSLEPGETTFIPYPGSSKVMGVSCSNAIGWAYRLFEWRYVRVKYVNGATAVGTARLVTRGRRT